MMHDYQAGAEPAQDYHDLLCAYSTGNQAGGGDAPACLTSRALHSRRGCAVRLLRRPWRPHKEGGAGQGTRCTLHSAAQVLRRHQQMAGRPGGAGRGAGRPGFQGPAPPTAGGSADGARAARERRGRRLASFLGWPARARRPSRRLGLCAAGPPATSFSYIYICPLGWVLPPPLPPPPPALRYKRRRWFSCSACTHAPPWPAPLRAENISQQMAEMGVTPELSRAMERMMMAGGAPTAGVTFTRTLSPEEQANLPPLCLAVSMFRNLPPGTAEHAQALQILRQTVAKGADVNVTGGPFGFTPLHFAAHGGDAEVAEALLAAPGAPALPGEPQCSPSLWAWCPLARATPATAAAALCCPGAWRGWPCLLCLPEPPPLPRLPSSLASLTPPPLPPPPPPPPRHPGGQAGGSGHHATAGRSALGPPGGGASAAGRRRQHRGGRPPHRQHRAAPG